MSARNSRTASLAGVVKLRHGTYGRFRGRWFHKPDFRLFKD